MLKKILRMIIVLVLSVLFINVTYAEEKSLYTVSCDDVGPKQNNYSLKTTTCSINIDNTSGYYKKGDSLNFELKFDKITEDYNGGLTTKEFSIITTKEFSIKNAKHTNDGITFNYIFGDSPKKKINAFEIELTTDTVAMLKDSGATLVLKNSNGDNELKLEPKNVQKIDLANTCKSLKLMTFHNGAIAQNKTDKSIYAKYKLVDNKALVDSDGNCRPLAALEGIIDVSKLPEGVKLAAASVNNGDNQYAPAITLNKDNGKWLIDFDLSENGVKYQKENEIIFTFEYKIEDSSKVTDSFYSTLIVNSFINKNSPTLIYKTDNGINTVFATKPIIFGNKDESFKKGDWDLNNELSLVDIINYRKYLVDPYDLEEKVFSLVDFNEDKKTSITDLIASRKELAEMSINM